LVKLDFVFSGFRKEHRLTGPKGVSGTGVALSVMAKL
jgi:hypothetical protein